MKGNILWFDCIRKFGFILSQEDEKQYFLSQSSLSVEYQPNQGDWIEFDILKTTGDMPDKAVNVRYIGEK